MLPRRRVLHRMPFENKSPEVGSRRWLVAELDRLVSAVVRGRDRRCVTCGSNRNLQCSHFYSRRHLGVRFDLRNSNAMCAGCNGRHNSDPAPYLAFMPERYGAEVVAELDVLRRSLRKVPGEKLWLLLRGRRRGIFEAAVIPHRFETKDHYWRVAFARRPPAVGSPENLT